MAEDKHGSIIAKVLKCVNYTNKEINTSVNRTVTLYWTTSSYPTV